MLPYIFWIWVYFEKFTVMYRVAINSTFIGGLKIALNIVLQNSSIATNVRDLYETEYYVCVC